MTGMLTLKLSSQRLRTSFIGLAKLRRRAGWKKHLSSTCEFPVDITVVLNDLTEGTPVEHLPYTASHAFPSLGQRTSVKHGSKGRTRAFEVWLYTLPP